MESLEGTPTKDEGKYLIIGPNTYIRNWLCSLCLKTLYSFYGAGEPIGENSLHKQIPSRLIDIFHFNPICKTLTSLINCESKSPGFARLCVKCNREYLNISVNK